MLSHATLQQRGGWDVYQLTDNGVKKLNMIEALRLGKEGLFYDAPEITSVLQSHEYFRNEYAFTTGQAEFLLKFQNPLELVSDRWGDGIGGVRDVGLADCETVYEHHDYLDVMREYTRRLGVALDSLGLDRVYRGSPTFDDSPIRAEDCFPEDMDLKGQVIAVKARTLAPEYRVASHQLYIATGGFGCSPNARGRAVFCKNIYNDESVRFDRDGILGVVKPECIPAWAKEKIAKLQAEKPSVMDEINHSKQETREQPATHETAPGKKKTNPEL